MNVIKLQHGCGGKPTAQLIEEIFYKAFSNDILLQGFDAAFLDMPSQKLAFTTDSFIVSPAFFSGGDIGKLAVCGTVNDLAVCGAKPLYLSCGMIIEEGFEMEKLHKIARSMAEAAQTLQLKIVTGDTKIVEKGNADGIYINTSGIGVVMSDYMPKTIKSGDVIIVSGSIGEHGAVVALNRFGIGQQSELRSDCDQVYSIVENLKEYFPHIKLMKDPTRGGLATSINEIASSCGIGAVLQESTVPVRADVKAICNMLGMDPLYLACEGRLLLIVDENKAEEILFRMKALEESKFAEIIGYIQGSCDKHVYLQNAYGVKRILPALEGDLLPRIC